MSCCPPISAEKLEQLSQSKRFANLSSCNQDFIAGLTERFAFSQQDLFQLAELATDFEMWDSGDLQDLWDESDIEHLNSKLRKQEVIRRLRTKWEDFRVSLPNYQNHHPLQKKGKITFSRKDSDDTVLGVCPVYSPKTRCCNLQTLDAVMNCGFECTYCSIQSFYHGEEIVFQGNFKEKLQKIEIDPNRTYHIGTGQASDSLLWGNKENVLGDLFEWAERHPNVILELKTKSANIRHLLDHPVPKNVIATWSLNAPTIAKNEEHRTASTSARISAARRVADKGVIVGFHFHPIVQFNGWDKEYPELISQLTEQFTPEEVALVSLGTLTFIKPVMKQLRDRKQKSKILQMPMEDAAGKFSYPIEQKEKFFKYIYDCFKPWHDKVFFYLCMEDPSLWPAVFGFDYESNDEFENAMKTAYLDKIQNNPKCQ